MKKISLILSLFLIVTLGLVTVASSAQLPQIEDEYNGLFFRNSEVLLDNDQNGEFSVGVIIWGVLQM